MSTIEDQIKSLNATNADLANKSNALTQAVQTQVTRIEQAVADAKSDMSSATTTTLNKVKSDAAKVNSEIQTRMDEAIKPWMPAMSKVQFDALREQRKHQYAGSGFVEWGKHISTPNYQFINEGMWTWLNRINSISLGVADSDIGGIGELSSNRAKALVDGVFLALSKVAHKDYVLFTLPPAPDGTKTYDSATGTVTEHSDAQAAFTSETATNKVITSRKDLVFLESWHEDISEKGVVYPLGNVQYGASSYGGISLQNSLVAQGYSAFGEWDQNTKGYGAKWSTLTDEQKTRFLSEPENNIYYDAQTNKFVQVRYRMRVVEGLGDDWQGRSQLSSGSGYSPYRSRYLGHGDFGDDVWQWMLPRGANVDYNDLSASVVSDHQIFQSANSQAVSNTVTLGDAGLWRVIGKDITAIPIALVQRLNQGAYHPVYNPMGTAQFTQTNVANYHWNTLPSNYYPSKAGCFELATPSRIGRHATYGTNSAGQTGRPGSYKYHDAIYAGQVEDLRLNANKLDVNQLREETMRKAVAGTLRGKESTIFTTVEAKKLAIATVYAGKYYVNLAGTVDIQNGYEIEPHNRPFSYLYNITRGNILYPIYVEPSGNIYTSDAPSILPENRFQNVGSTTLLDWQVGDDVYLIKGEQMTSEFDSLPWVDIIGSPENIAATFPSGVVGQWLPQIPDGQQNYELNRKAITNNGLNMAITFTNDNGESGWEVRNGNDWNFNLIASSLNTNIAQTTVALISYESASVFTQAQASKRVLGDLGSVYATQAHRKEYGNKLQFSLTQNIGKRMDSALFQEFLPLSKHTYYSPHQTLSWSARAGDEPLHPAISLDAPNDNSPAVKTLYSITQSNGLLYMQFNGAQMQYQLHDVQLANSSVSQSFTKGQVYRFSLGAFKGIVVQALATLTGIIEDVAYVNDNGEVVGIASGNVVFAPVNFKGSWGDDQTIQIVDGEDVKTDLNGNTVKVFCHHTQFPIGIAYNN
ncbi:hypothetical protein PA25_19370 [Pseudoalteromonas sp. A25]|uniref:hypothetical protein n=1 Tax=Pseudoalteromonas sp. A25 TaxID=116092 RepID=UPI00126103C5|nr:hypothetical protein [Pseudoalteromonas sp. A25]BBN81952.1 hypothetical protein PA25_19370 [Pseudoalteromonas sp. A25]